METKIFEIQYSVPGSEVWRKNKLAFVATVTAQRAVQLLLEEQPRADIWQVIHRSRSGAGIIIDPECRV